MKIVGIKDRADNGRKLYPYQEEYIKRIFERLMENERRDNIVFQLPTGGGKTVSGRAHSPVHSGRHRGANRK